MSFLDDIGRVHLVGAGGIGLSAVGKLLKHEGMEVSGSDIGENEMTRGLSRAGIPVAKGHAAANLPEGAGLLIYSSAVPADNPERQEARRRGVREMSYFEFLGEYSKEKWTVAVSGTHGKSTTTALLGLMLERAGFDPTVIVGSKVPSFPDKNLRLGHGKYFVVEACEHEANMLKLFPQMIVLTCVEEDHLDYYRDLGHIRETFQKYVDKLPPDGTLVLNADDHLSFYELEPKTPFVTYGIDSPADYVGRGLRSAGGKQSFSLLRTSGHEETLGDFEMLIPGRFNVMNALAASAAALELGAAPEAVRAALAGFPGIWRRFERLGEKNGAVVISDYGHHPTAVSVTLEAARELYPQRRIVLAFQPHQRNRTRKLWGEFVSSFDGADALILAEIFDVAGREAPEDAAVSSRQLVEAIKERDAKRGAARDVIYADSPESALAELRRRLASNDLVLIMGAGDIYLIAEKLVS